MLLVDDIEEIRVVLRYAIRHRPNLELVAEAASGGDAISLAEQHQPELVVLDLGLPDLAGREVMSRLRVVSPSSRIVVYTGTEATERSPAVREADGFAVKDNNVDYLLDLLEDAARASHLSATLGIDTNLRNVRGVRQWMRARCVEWNCEDGVEKSLLVVSELVTNAVVHAGTPCVVTARRAPGVIRVEVSDGDATPPDVLDAADLDEHGRGMLLVSSMAVAWGVAPMAGGGKLVWAEMLCDDPVPVSP